MKFSIAITLVCIAAIGYAQDVLTPGQARVDATFHHIGAVWKFSGDLDLDSTFKMEYKEKGESKFRKAAEGMRSWPSLEVNGNALNLNQWAASAMFLKSDTQYVVKLTLTDPDSQVYTKKLNVKTKKLRKVKPGANHVEKWVVPGNGGGSGTEQDPYQGLQAAADSVSSSTASFFHVAAGKYDPFILSTSGVSSKYSHVFQGPKNGKAIIDGGNTDRHVVQLGEFGSTTSYLTLDRLTIRNGMWGVDAQNTKNILISNCEIKDVGFGIYNRRDDGVETYQTIVNNVIQGRTTWPGTGIPGERGIDLRGWGNVVAGNKVSKFGDCISIQPFTSDSYGNDIYLNTMEKCVDDGIEIDYNQANARVYRNRVYNCRMGVSVSPVYGGPAYVFRNELVNFESKPIKQHNQMAGTIIAHNSATRLGTGIADFENWRNTKYRNNVIMGSSGYAFEFGVAAAEGFRDLDYDAWYTPSTPMFKWDNVRYDDLEALQAATGQETHGMITHPDHFKSVDLTEAYTTAVKTKDIDFRLKSGNAEERDAGKKLNNLNDPYVPDNKPDLGAFEFKHNLPKYGLGYNPFTDNCDGSGKDKPSDVPGVKTPTVTSNSIKVTWKEPTFGGEAEKYHLQYRPSASSSWSNASKKIKNKKFTIGGLDSNTDYEVRVRATNCVGSGSWSKVKTARTD